jgi:hypothetical protein
MRVVILSLLIACVCFDLIGDAKAAPWTSAKFPGEQNRAVQGCADNPQNSGDWLCIVVLPEPDIQGDIELMIDENTFALSVPRSLKSELPLSTRALVVPNGLIHAMKSGHMIVIKGSRLQAPYNQISLENSRTAIERVERACGRRFPGAAGFLKRIARSLGVF